MSNPSPEPDFQPAFDLPARFPFWGWDDVGLFCGAVAPAFLLAQLLMRGVRLVSGGSLNQTAELLASQFAAYLLLFLALYAIFHYRHGRPLFDSLRWSASGREILLSLLAGPVIALAVLITASALETPRVSSPMLDLLDSRLSVLLIGLFAVTLGPLCEELAFRGLLQPLISRTAGAGLGILLAAVPFALLHGPQYAWSWRHVMLIGLAGVAFGWTRYRTGSTAAATAIHSTYNLTFLIGFVLTEGDTLKPW